MADSLPTQRKTDLARRAEAAFVVALVLADLAVFSHMLSRDPFANWLRTLLVVPYLAFPLCLLAARTKRAHAGGWSDGMLRPSSPILWALAAGVIVLLPSVIASTFVPEQNLFASLAPYWDVWRLRFLDAVEWTVLAFVFLTPIACSAMALARMRPRWIALAAAPAVLALAAVLVTRAYFGFRVLRYLF